MVRTSAAPSGATQENCSASSSTIWRQAASASSRKVVKAPLLGRSAGISAVASHWPLTKRNRSSWGRTEVSVCAVSSTPARTASVAGELLAGWER